MQLLSYSLTDLSHSLDKQRDISLIIESILIRGSSSIAFPMEMMPLELLHLIAETDELTYRAMLIIHFFARSITMGKILDYMVLFQHDVKVKHGTII